MPPFTPDQLKSLYQKAIAASTRQQFGNHDRGSYSLKPDLVWHCFAELLNKEIEAKAERQAQTRAEIRQKLRQLLGRRPNTF
jgi:hypothetical protein